MRVAHLSRSLFPFVLPFALALAACGQKNVDAGDPNKGNITPKPAIAVLDFENATDYKTGDPGHKFCSELSMAWRVSRAYNVYDRTLLDKAIKDTGQTAPFSLDAQVMIADKMNCRHIIGGTIKKAEILRNGQETYASVTVEGVVVFAIAKAPINGARVTAESSRNIDYKGDTDALMKEALRAAAAKMAQTLADSLAPIGVVLTAERGGNVITMGGTKDGFRVGMELITFRRTEITGKIRLIECTGGDSTAQIVTAGTIAPGDRCVPVFTLEPEAEKPADAPAGK